MRNHVNLSAVLTLNKRARCYVRKMSWKGSKPKYDIKFMSILGKGGVTLSNEEATMLKV